MKTRMMRYAATGAIVLSLAVGRGRAQAPVSTSVLGQVESVDAAARTLKVKPDAGAVVTIGLAEKAAVVKVAPGEKSLQNAAPISFEGIVTGDRVLVNGGTRSDNRIEGALRVIVMAKTDLAARDAEEQRAWRERAVVGTVTAVDPANNQFTIRVSSTASAAPAADGLVVDAQKATLHRYADRSARFDDAKPATVKDIALGDQLRLLGTRSAEGSRMTADRVVFGSFKTRALAIEKVDAEAGLLEVKDLESNQKFIMTIVAGGSIRRIPAEMGPMLTMMAGGGGGAAGRPGGFRPQGAGSDGANATGGRPQGAGPRQAAPGGPGSREAGGPARGGRGMMDIVEKMPAITVTDLKKDDWVGAVVGKIDAAGNAVAFNVLAGIEIFASRANRDGGVDVGMPAGLLDGGIGVP